MLQNKSISQIPIFMYHHILPLSSTACGIFKNNPYSISSEQFKRQLNLLSLNRYRVVLLKKALAMRSSMDMDYNNCVVISFDDGYLNNYEMAFPLLNMMRFKASFFVVSDWISSRNDCMTWNELIEMANQGMEIGSHTKTHIALGECTVKETTKELEHSKKTIEDRIGQEVNLLSFPHGSFNEETLRIAKILGYRAGCSSNWGYFSGLSDILSIERIAIKRTHTENHFNAICKKKRLLRFKMHLVNNLKMKIQRTIGIQIYNQIFDWIYNTSEIS